MKAKINTQEVEVYGIRINYIKLGHERVQLLIEYYNVITAASTHKIYTKSISIFPNKPYSILLLHFLAST